MKTILATLVMVFSLLSVGAQAQVSRDLLGALPTSVGPFPAYQEHADGGAIALKGAVIQNGLFEKTIYLELEIANIDWRRDVYVVNHSNEANRNNRETQAIFVKSYKDYAWTQKRTAILYVDDVPGNRARFLIQTSAIARASVIDVYVKMGGRQYSTRIKARSF